MNSEFGQSFNVRNGSNPASDLDLRADVQDVANNLAIISCVFSESGVKIDHVDQFSTSRNKLSRNFNRFFAVNGEQRFLALDQAHALTVAQVDCRNYLHYKPRLVTKVSTPSHSLPLVAI